MCVRVMTFFAALHLFVVDVPGMKCVNRMHVYEMFGRKLQIQS